MMYRKMRKKCVQGSPSAQGIKSFKDIDDDSNDPKDFHGGVRVRTRRKREKRTRTDFYRNERDDNLLEAFGMSTGHRLLQELQHVLQHLDAGVEQVNALRDLEITSCRVVEWSQVGVRLWAAQTDARTGNSSVSARLGWSRLKLLTQNTSGESNTEPTAAMLARRRNNSPILRMISTGKNA
jgi:hypothetical protein